MFSQIETHVALTLKSQVIYKECCAPLHVYKTLTLIRHSTLHENYYIVFKDGKELYREKKDDFFLCAYENYVTFYRQHHGYFKYMIEEEGLKLVDIGPHRIHLMVKSFDVACGWRNARESYTVVKHRYRIPHKSDRYTLSRVVPVNNHQDIGVIYDRRLLLYDQSAQRIRLLNEVDSKCRKFDYLPDLHSLVTHQPRWNHSKTGKLLFWDDRKLNEPVKCVQGVCEFYGFVNDQVCYRKHSSLNIFMGEQILYSPLPRDELDSQIRVINNSIFYLRTNGETIHHMY